MQNVTKSSIEIRDLHFGFRNRAIFKGVNLTIQPGKITAIMGPSGTGKTTLLRLLGGQLRPDNGSVEIHGQDVHRISRRQLYKLRRDMGLLFQSGALFTDLDVYENVAFPLREHTSFTESLIHNLVLMKLEIVGLRGAKNLMTSQLSGGMARRVALARAIALDPGIIMYDEPFVGLDPISRGVIVDLIHKLNSTLSMTSILVSHDVPEVAKIADYIYIVFDGKIVGQGTPKSLSLDETPAVKQFISGFSDGVVPFHYPGIDYAEDLISND